MDIVTNTATEKFSAFPRRNPVVNTEELQLVRTTKDDFNDNANEKYVTRMEKVSDYRTSGLYK